MTPKEVSGQYKEWAEERVSEEDEKLLRDTALFSEMLPQKFGEEERKGPEFLFERPEHRVHRKFLSLKRRAREFIRFVEHLGGIPTKDLEKMRRYAFLEPLLGRIRNRKELKKRAVEASRRVEPEEAESESGSEEILSVETVEMHRERGRVLSKELLEKTPARERAFSFMEALKRKEDKDI
jgi:hypothetical protein